MGVYFSLKGSLICHKERCPTSSVVLDIISKREIGKLKFPNWFPLLDIIFPAGGSF